ncbi:hypothetical protein V8E52_010397 [Russula decolorans]
MWARTLVDLLLLSWSRALPSSFAFLPKELLDGLDRIHHLTVDDIGEHRYHSHTQLSSSALLCLQSTSYPPSALQNRARRAAGIREWCNGVLFFLNALRSSLTYYGTSTPPWLHHGSCAGCKCPHGPGNQPTNQRMGRNYRRDVVHHDALYSNILSSSLDSHKFFDY